jgi:hypothetical protein
MSKKMALNFDILAGAIRILVIHPTYKYFAILLITLSAYLINLLATKWVSYTQKPLVKVSAWNQLRQLQVLCLEH